jgi:hypothetical protein
VTVNGSVNRDQLRALVREVVREAVAGVVPTPVSTASATPPPVAHQIATQPTGPLAADQKARTDTVRIASDQDLDGFVRQLLRLFENPKTRADLRAGRLTFRLASNGHGAQVVTHRIDSGAVTERHVADMAASGGVLVLGRKAVLTPLAREKARALGITIEKERN